MKMKLSISMDRSTVTRIQEKMSNGRFRNKSHLIEFAVRQFIERK